MDTSPRTALYIRVSSDQQTTLSQEEELNRWLKANGEDVARYSDKFTGKTMRRPGWDKLMEAVRRGEVNRIVVWRLDRLGRTLSGLSHLFDELLQRKVTLVSLRDGVDLATPAGRLMAGVLASMAQYETEIRAERVRAGQQAAKARGKKWGGSLPGPRTVTPEQISTIREKHENGASIAAISRAVNLSRPTVYAYLRSGWQEYRHKAGK